MMNDKVLRGGGLQLYVHHTYLLHRFETQLSFKSHNPRTGTTVATSISQQYTWLRHRHDDDFVWV